MVTFKIEAMKTMKRILSAAASVLMLAACVKEAPIAPQPVKEGYLRSVTFVSGDKSKTFLHDDLKTTTWENTSEEMVHLWEGNVPIPSNEEGQKSTMEIEAKYLPDRLVLYADMEYEPEEENPTYYSVVAAEATKTTAKVQSEQSPAINSFDPNAELLVALPSKADETISDKGETLSQVSLKYNRPVAVAVMTLKDLTPGDKVQKVTINADVDLTGTINFKYNDTGVKVEYPEPGSEGTGKTIVCNYTENNVVGEKGEFPVYFVSLNASVTEFFIEVTTDKFKYERKTGTLKTPIELNDNRVATFGFKLDKADKAELGDPGFILIENTLEDWSGEYLIVSDDNNYAMSLRDGNKNANTYGKYVSVTGYYDKENKCFAENETTRGLIYTATKTTNGYSLYCNSDETYLGITSGTTSTGAKLRWDSSYTENVSEWVFGVNSLKNVGSPTLYLRWNNNSGSERFAAYNSTGVKPIQLYKYKAGGDGLFALHTPTNIAFVDKDKKFTWDEVENAASYTLTYNTENGEPVEVNGIETNFYVPASIADEYYKATVVAHPVTGSEKYKDSPAGENEGWLKVGTPRMPKYDGKNIGISMTDETITMEWEADALQTYKAYITTVGTTDVPAVTIETFDDIMASGKVSVTFGSTTPLSPATSYNVYLVVKANMVSGRSYEDSQATQRKTETANPVLISEIKATGKYYVESAVICAKADTMFFVKDNVESDAGYICVNKPTEIAIGNEVTIGGTVEISDSQLRFNSEAGITDKGAVAFSQPTPSTYTTFNYAEYVTVIGKTSGKNASPTYITVTQADETKVKLLVTSVKDQKTLDAGLYVEVTGYLVFQKSGGSSYMMATQIKDNTIEVSNDNPEWLAEETNETSIGVTSDSDDWTFSPESDDNWNIAKSGNNLIVSPKAQNGLAQKKELVVNIIHGRNATYKVPVTLTQKGKLTTYNLVTSVGDLFDGARITIGLDAGSSYGGVKALGEMKTKFFDVVGAEFLNGALKTNEATQLVLGHSGDYWTLSDVDGKKLGATSDNNRDLYYEGGTTTTCIYTWTIDVDDSYNATITCTAGSSNNGKILYNHNTGGSPRFKCYANTSTTILPIQIYMLDNGKHPDGVTLNETSLEIMENSTATLVATITPEDAGNKGVTWSSSNTTVATVDKGVVTAVAPGDATITVTTKDGGITATCKVNVISLPKYDIACEVPGGHGSVTANPTSAKVGDIVTITVSADEGYELKTLVAEGNTFKKELSTIDNTFEMPNEDVTVSAEFKEKGITKTIVINKTSSGVTGTYTDPTFTIGGISFYAKQWCSSSDFIQAKASQSPSVYNTTAIPGYIKSITVVTGSGKTARAVTVYGGTSSEPTNQITSPTTAQTMIFDFTGKEYTYFKLCTPGNACYFDNITIEYEAGDEPTPELYTVTVSDGIQHGSVKASSTSAEAGTEITLEATPDPGYELDAWDVKDASDNPIDVTNNKFTMPASNVTVSATFKTSGGGGKVYTLSFTKNTNANNYATASEQTSSSITWEVYANCSLGDYIRVGGKNTTDTDRTLTSKSNLPAGIKKVVINHLGIGNGKSSSITINTISVAVNGGETKTLANPSVSSSGELEFVFNTAQKAAIYTITINYKISGNNNCYLTINYIDFYN